MSKKNHKKITKKASSPKRVSIRKEEALKARLAEEVDALVQTTPKTAAPEAGLPPDKQKIRQELLAEIAALDNEPTPVVKKTKPGKETASPPALPNEPAAASTPATPNTASAPLKPVVEQAELKVRLKLRRFHKKLWFLLPVMAVIIYGGFNILRLDKMYPLVSSYLPWPAAIVNNKIIWLDELHRETALVAKFEISPKPEELAINHLFEEQIVEESFQKYNLNLPPQALIEQLNTFITEFGSEQAFVDYLEANYGLTRDEFSKYILLPYLRRLTLQEYLSHNPKESAVAEERARQIKQSIESNEISFSEAASRYSDDVVSAQAGGSLGWFTWGAMIPEFEAALRSLAVGEISAPIRSAYGYHLIRLDEVEGPRPTNHDDSSLGSVQASHIFILVLNFDSWLEEQKKTLAKVLLVPLKN